MKNIITWENAEQKYKKALCMACTAHALQKWGTLPYYEHLLAVEQVLIDLGYRDDSIRGFQIGIVSLFHDMLEDSGLYSYNDLKEEFGFEVAEAVYLMTENKGRNRKERKPLSYYTAIGGNVIAGLVKTADRIANVQFSFKNKSTMFTKYKDEQKDFEIIYEQNPEAFLEIFSILRNLLTIQI